MNILMIDTSQSHLLIGLKRGHEIREKVIPHINQLGILLASSVSTLLEETGLTPSALHQIRVGAGPGSYTGTRVGIAFAESLAYGLDIPCIKIPSLAFFLPKDKKTLHLKSKFNTAYFAELENGVLMHCLIDTSLATEERGPEWTPQTAFMPNWIQIASLIPSPKVESALYFTQTPS